MTELLDRSRLRKLALPRAFMQDMLIPFRGAHGATYRVAWGEKDDLGQRRYEAELRSFSEVASHRPRELKLRKNGTPRVSRKRNRALGPEHADLIVALELLQQARIDSGDLYGISFQSLWRAMHGFRPCGNYSGAWKKKISRALDELQRCEFTLVDRGPTSGAGRLPEPAVVRGPLLRVFWVNKHCRIGGREMEAQAIERILWGPAIEQMHSENLTMTFRADEYFAIRSAPARIAYLFAPAPAAARARDTMANHPDGVTPSDFSQSSATLLMKLGYTPDEIADRCRRHRLLVPLQASLDRKALANGHLSVSVTRHHPPGTPRADWRLSFRVMNRRPNQASPVEDVTFLAAMEGGRSKNDLYAALRRLPELEHSELDAINAIWPSATRAHALSWAKKAKALMLIEDRPTFAEILAEVRMLQREGYRFRKAPAAMAVGLTHQLLRTHDWPLPQRRTHAPP